MITRVKSFLARHPHIGHNLHHSMHVAYFIGVATGFGKMYAVIAGLLAVIGAVSIFKGGEP